jgi:hypothetical protein
MLRRSVFLTLVLGLIATGAAQSAPEEVLPAGTLLQCTLDEPNLSSQTAQPGDPILCNASALSAFGSSVFPRGAYLAGHFQDHREPGRFVGKGWINLEFDRLVLPHAVVLPLSAKVISVPHLRVDREGKIHGRGHPKRDAVGWLIPMLWPVKVIRLPARGPRPTLKGEVRITLRLMEDVEVPAAVTASRTSSWIPRPTQFREGGSSTQGPPPQLWRSFSRLALAANPTPTTSSTPPREQEQVVGLGYFVDRPSVPQITLLILKDGTGYLASDYWLESGVLHYVNAHSQYKLLPLARLDLEETVKLNRERKVEFTLRSQDGSQP